MRCRGERAWLITALALLPLLALIPLGASAQPLHAMSAHSAKAEEAASPDRRLYVGMWTYHFREPDRGLDNNWLLAVSWGRIYGATFINSFGKRAYSAGLQGTVARWNPRIVSLSLGYRAGVVTGYDERFLPIAGRIPVLPLFQPLMMLDAKRLGLEFSYSGVVASGGINMRL